MKSSFAVNRRGTLVWILTILLAAVTSGTAQAQVRTVSIAYDANSPQASYAATQLGAAIARKHYALVSAGKPANFKVTLALTPGKLAPEAFAITARRGSLAVTGGDSRGMIYGALAVVEQLDGGRTVQNLKSGAEKPALGFRAIKFDLPWDSYRSSAALDQHLNTVRDERFWAAFFDMMVRNRFNAITLSNLHPVRRQHLWPRKGVADNGGIGSRRSDVRNADETQSLQPKIGW